MAARVLYVDGDPDRREDVASRIARAAEWTVRSESEPGDAVEAVRREPITCVVTPHRLAGWSGLELAAAVRRVADCPVVLLAAATEPAAGKLSLAADAFVRQGEEIPVERLIEAVEQVQENTPTRTEPPAHAEEPTRGGRAIEHHDETSSSDGTDESPSVDPTIEASSADSGDGASSPDPSDGASSPDPSGSSSSLEASDGASSPDPSDSTSSPDPSDSGSSLEASDGASSPDLSDSAPSLEPSEGEASTGGTDTELSLDPPDREPSVPTRGGSTAGGSQSVEMSEPEAAGLIRNTPWPTALARAMPDDTIRLVSVNDAFERRFGFDEAETASDPLADSVAVQLPAERLREAVFRSEPFTTTVERPTVTGEREFPVLVVPTGPAAPDGGTTVEGGGGPPAMAWVVYADGGTTTGARIVETDGTTDDGVAGDDSLATDDSVVADDSTTDDSDSPMARGSAESLRELAETLPEAPTAVYEQTVETATQLVDADRATVYERHGHGFEPVAGCESIAPEQIVRRVAEDGEPRLTTDDTVGRDDATVAVAVGEAVLRVGTDDASRFDRDTLAVVRLVGTVATRLLGRLDQQTMLDRRERQLENHDDRMRQFAQLVSQDLRSPLEVARGNVELGMLQGDESRLEAAIDALDRADELIEDMLTFAQTGEHVTDEQTVFVADIAREAWSSEFDGQLLVDTNRRLEADADRLGQLFENLFVNAVEHGQSGDEPITVRVLDTPTGIAVADDGVGFPADDETELVAPGVSTTEDATGYGLSVVREIANAHGWSVSLGESDPGGARIDLSIGGK